MIDLENNEHSDGSKQDYRVIYTGTFTDPILIPKKVTAETVKQVA